MAGDVRGVTGQRRPVAWCREEMANYKVPRFVDIVPELPTNASGKVQKFLLRDRAKAYGDA